MFLFDFFGTVEVIGSIMRNVVAGERSVLRAAIPGP